MVSLTDTSLLSGAALLGQSTLTDSILDSATTLESSTSLTRTLGTIRSMGNGSAYTPGQISTHTSETVLDTPSLFSQPTTLETTAASNSSEEAETTSEKDNLDSDLLTGMVESSPLVNSTAAIQLPSIDLQKLASAGVSIKDTNYFIPSGTRFVSPTGNNANPGTQAAPWRTLGKAIQSAPGGSTVVIRGGTYREGDLSFNKKLTLQPYPHEKVWIKGSLVVTGWVREGDLWRKDNWNHKFDPIPTSDPQIDPSYPEAGHKEMVFIDGTSIKQVLSKAKVDPGEFYLDRTSNKLYIGSNPAGKTVEATAFEKALTLNQPSASSVVRGLGFAHYAETGVTAYTQNITLQNNTIVWNSIDGVLLHGGSGAIARGNNISYNGKTGLTGRQTQGTLVEQNTLGYNNIKNFRSLGTAGSIKLSNSNNVIVRDNVVVNNNAHGIWFDVSVTNVTAVRNIVKDNNGHGINFEISHKAIIASNVSVRNQRHGIYINNSSSAQVWNNTLADNVESDLYVTEGDRNNTNQAEISRGITWKTNNTVIMNNLFSGIQRSGSENFLLNIWTDSYNGELGPMVSKLNSNGYYRSSTSQPPSILRYKPDKDLSQGVRYRTLGAFKQANSGKETNGFEIVQGNNPFFVNKASGNYRLKLGSRAIKAGAPLPVDVARAIGVQADVKVNLGAI